MAEIQLGTCGWSYREWNRVFYPSAETRKLAYYSTVFSTVEIDSTFYAYPSLRTVEGWVRQTPPHFVFSAKLPKLITHDKRLDVEKNVVQDLFKFLNIMRPLISDNKLGPVLIQLPPSFSFEDGYGRLKSFIKVLPGDVMFAVEFRHNSWLREDVSGFLSKNGIANAIVDEPLLPSRLTVTSDFALIRWHGRGRKPWYNYRYGDDELKNWKPKLEELSKKTKRVYGYFNNHFHGFAVENSLKMIEITGNSSPEQKEALRRVTKHFDGAERSGGDKGLLDFADENQKT